MVFLIRVHRRKHPPQIQFAKARFWLIRWERRIFSNLRIRRQLRFCWHYLIRLRLHAGKHPFIRQALRILKHRLIRRDITEQPCSYGERAKYPQDNATDSHNHRYHNGRIFHKNDADQSRRRPPPGAHPGTPTGTPDSSGSPANRTGAAHGNLFQASQA